MRKYKTHVVFQLAANKAEDVWALGVTLFFLLTGRHPWREASMRDSEFAQFRRRELGHAPWSSFAPQLNEVRHSK